MVQMDEFYDKILDMSEGSQFTYKGIRVYSCIAGGYSVKVAKKGSLICHYAYADDAARGAARRAGRKA